MNYFFVNFRSFIFRLSVLIVFWGLTSATKAKAQDCDLACYGTLEQPVSITLNDQCSITITPDVLLPDQGPCPGQKRFTVRDSLNTLVADNFDMVQFYAGNYVGNRLSVTITDQATGTFCVSIIRIVDNTAPIITNCPEVTVSCLDSTSPDILGFPTAIDNCTNNLVPGFIDNIILKDCLTDTAAIVIREWTVSDGHGMNATCSQQINVLRASSMDVDFPIDIILPCNDPAADTDRTGVPLLNGMPLMHGDLCGLTVSFVDDTIAICNDYMYRIDRTWTVEENCTGFSDSRTQQILISDEQGPVMSCPAPFTVGMDGGQCTATITPQLLPLPITVVRPLPSRSPLRMELPTSIHALRCTSRHSPNSIHRYG
ncbi:MAG: hypothetical protein R2795_03590 [Saprospiraceae bacterium]